MRHIEINASEKLLEYMDRKGYHCIAVEPLSPKGCCADMTGSTLVLCAIKMFLD